MLKSNYVLTILSDIFALIMICFLAFSLLTFSMYFSEYKTPITYACDSETDFDEKQLNDSMYPDVDISLSFYK